MKCMYCRPKEEIKHLREMRKSGQRTMTRLDSCVPSSMPTGKEKEKVSLESLEGKQEAKEQDPQAERQKAKEKGLASIAGSQDTVRMSVGHRKCPLTRDHALHAAKRVIKLGSAQISLVQEQT